jgi:peptidyl-prolyl cis-trans isomerase D
VAVSVVRPYVSLSLKNKKKKQLIKAKMTGSLEVIAKAVGGTVQQATDLTMENTMLPNVGPEAKVERICTSIKICTNRRKQRCLCCKNVSTVKAPV